MRRKVTLTIYLTFASLFLQAQVWKPLSNGLEKRPTATTSISHVVATAQAIGFKDGYKIHRISLWNGYYWLNLPDIYSDSLSVITSLKYYKNALYIGGKMTNIRGLTKAKHLIRWKDRKFEAVQNVTDSLSVNASIRGMTVYNGMLLMHGNFVLNRTYGKSLLAFNGTNLLNNLGAAFGSGINGSIHTVYSNDSLLIFAGRFTKVNDTASVNIAYFSNGKWKRYPLNKTIPTHIEMLGNKIVVGGYTSSNKALNFYQLQPSALDSTNNNLHAITEIYDMQRVGDSIYASGQFYSSSTADVRSMMVYDGSKWSAVTNGNILGVRLLESFRGNLLATGFFSFINNIPHNHISEYLPNHGIVYGRIYHDKDENCSFSNRDEYLANLNVVIQPGKHYVKPNDNGTYLRYLPKGSYSAEVIFKKYWEPSACSSDSIKIDLSKDELSQNIDFPLVQPSDIHDLSISLSSESGLTALRDGRNNYTARIKNNGSAYAKNIKVHLDYDTVFVELQSSLNTDSTSNHFAGWEIAELYPGQVTEVKFSFALNVVNAVQTTFLKARVFSSDPEAFSEDNESQLVMSLDEDDYEFKKEIIPSYSDTVYIHSDEESIEYQISFANYTSDTIFNVYVIDTIRLNHSLSLIQTTGASHPVSAEAFPGLPGEDLGIIIWTFEDINLIPNPTHNPEIVAHKGYVSFKLGLNKGLTQGIELSNKGNVVFDFYETEPTNWVYAIVNEDLADIPEIESRSIHVYPNPATSALFLGNNDLDRADYEILAANGQVISSGQVALNRIDISAAAKGLYILSIRAQNEIFTERFIKL